MHIHIYQDPVFSGIFHDVKIISIFVHTQEDYLNLLWIYAKEWFVTLWLMESKCIWNIISSYMLGSKLIFFSKIQDFVIPFKE